MESASFALFAFQPMPTADLDSFDRAILALLQQDNLMPQRLIAEQINLSAPAVQRRIKRLQETGVIAANVARLCCINRP